jgi:hypothetical protein
MTLTTVRDINTACRRFTPVIAIVEGTAGAVQVRIIRARTHKGVLQGLTLGLQRWLPIVKVWTA